MKKDYQYEFKEFPLYTSPKEIQDTILDLANVGYKLVHVIENYTYFTETAAYSQYKNECTFLIFEKENVYDI